MLEPSYSINIGQNYIQNNIPLYKSTRRLQDTNGVRQKRHPLVSLLNDTKFETVAVYQA